MINGQRSLLLALCLVACRGSSHGADGTAPAATEIPAAAPNARGADYPPPVQVVQPVPNSQPRPGRPPLPQDEVDDPFAPPHPRDRAPRDPLGEGGGTRL